MDISMDVNSKVSDLLASEPVVPDYESKWSDTGRRMEHQTMRQTPVNNANKIIRLDIGQPNIDLSVVKDIDFTLTDGTKISVDHSFIRTLGLYGQMSGMPELQQWLIDLHRREHKPPQLTNPNHPVKFSLAVSVGITQGLSSIVKALLNLDGSDTILMEEIGYVSFIGALQMHGCHIEGVPFDDFGMDPIALEKLLANWGDHYPTKSMPKMLYTVASASNPLGNNWDVGRMVDIYRVCRKYDIIIIDDGAYYYLQFGERPMSFQSLDVDGRVVRFDTFSKIIGAGYRIGWYSGPDPIIDKCIINHEVTCVHASSITQAMVYSMLNLWGHQGFERHIRSVATFYQKKAQCAIQAFEKHLKGLATWTVPKGGMFIWITLTCLEDSAPVCQALRGEDIDIRLVPGKFFRVVPGLNKCMRFCFSMESDENLEEAAKVMSATIRKMIASKSQ